MEAKRSSIMKKSPNIRFRSQRSMKSKLITLQIKQLLTQWPSAAAPGFNMSPPLHLTQTQLTPSCLLWELLQKHVLRSDTDVGQQGLPLSRCPYLFQTPWSCCSHVGPNLQSLDQKVLQKVLKCRNIKSHVCNQEAKSDSWKPGSRCALPSTKLYMWNSAEPSCTTWSGEPLSEAGSDPVWRTLGL